MDGKQNTLDPTPNFTPEPRVVMRLRDEVAERSYANPVEFLKKIDPEGWAAITRQHGDLSVRPAIKPERQKKLADYQRRAVETDPSYEPAEFRAFYYVEGKELGDPQQLAVDLRRLSPVRGVDVEVLGPPPLVDPTDDPRFTAQGYLGAAPAGIDAVYAWSVPGGDGSGQRIVDVEGGWALTHEDLAAHNATLIHGVHRPDWVGHGTAVLGEICAVDNTVGCVGIAPNVDSVRCSSIWLDAANNYDIVEAVLAAFDELRFGDVLLIELQIQAYNLGGIPVYGPIEVYDMWFEVLRLATALGIVVVEAGGNGFNNGGTPAVDLDTYNQYGYSTGAQILNPNSPDFRDSGAIMVAAATSAAPHFRLAYSTYGARIDCFSWGQNVETTNSDMYYSTLYTSGFSGTSSASPVIAGAALLLQGACEAANGFRLSPWQVRNLLSDPTINTLPDPSEPTLIGVQPNLAAIFNAAAIAAVPDVYVRDNLADTGDLHTGGLSMSPDIIVRNDSVPNPQAAFGVGSGTENSLALSDTVEAGQDNYVYVRALNQGSVDAATVRATVYWSQPSTLVAPASWNLIGTVNIANIPTGETLHCSSELVWDRYDVPGTGHYCFVAVLDHPLDPAPSLVSLGDFATYMSFVRNNNNVTWRNFNVHDVLPDVPTVDHIQLRVRGWHDAELPFRVGIETRFPSNVDLAIEIPVDLLKRLRSRFEIKRFDRRRDVVTVRIPGRGKIDLGVGVLPAGADYQLKVAVDAPKGFSAPGQITAIQRYAGDDAENLRGDEVGRVTWLYRPTVDKRPSKTDKPVRSKPARRSPKAVGSSAASNGKPNGRSTPRPKERASRATTRSK